MPMVSLSGRKTLWKQGDSNHCVRAFWQSLPSPTVFSYNRVMAKMSEKLSALIYRFPKGSIWQTRYICLPASIALATLGLSHGSLAVASRFAYFILGIVLWTFLEYLLHRFVLHHHPRNVVTKSVIDRLHIFHHNDPKDHTQVCIPFVMSVVLWGILFSSLLLFGGGFQGSFLVTVGVAFMMTIYDITHYSTHYMQPTNRWLKILKRHHMLHHHADHTKRFGVTSPFWDHVFRTIWNTALPGPIYCRGQTYVSSVRIKQYLAQSMVGVDPCVDPRQSNAFWDETILSRADTWVRPYVSNGHI